MWIPPQKKNDETSVPRKCSLNLILKCVKEKHVPKLVFFPSRTIFGYAGSFWWVMKQSGTYIINESDSKITNKYPKQHYFSLFIWFVHIFRRPFLLKNPQKLEHTHQTDLNRCIGNGPNRDRRTRHKGRLYVYKNLQKPTLMRNVWSIYLPTYLHLGSLGMLRG